jgi:ferredoxin
MDITIDSLDMYILPQTSSFLSLLEHNEVPIKSTCRNGMCGQCKCKSNKGKDFLSCVTPTQSLVANGISQIHVYKKFVF